jgi:hypothetical protein
LDLFHAALHPVEMVQPHESMQPAHAQVKTRWGLGNGARPRKGQDALRTSSKGPSQGKRQNARGERPDTHRTRSPTFAVAAAGLQAPDMEAICQVQRVRDTVCCCPRGDRGGVGPLGLVPAASSWTPVLVYRPLKSGGQQKASGTAVLALSVSVISLLCSPILYLMQLFSATFSSDPLKLDTRTRVCSFLYVARAQMQAAAAAAHANASFNVAQAACDHDGEVHRMAPA